MRSFVEFRARGRKTRFGRRAGRWLHEIPARRQADEPLIARQKRVGEGEEASPDDARRIANTQAVLRRGCCERILDEKPPEIPCRAQKVFAKRALIGRALIPMGTTEEEPRHVGQSGSEDRLYLKSCQRSPARAEERGCAHSPTLLRVRPRSSARAFSALMYRSQLR